MEHTKEQTNPRAVLWDMDGTLIDSSEYHWLAWRDVMEQEDRPITYDDFAASFGQRNDTILRGYFGPDIPLNEIDRIASVKEATYRNLVRSRGIDLLPGVQQWIEYLHQHQWRQAVASAAPLRNIETILDVLDLGGSFGALVSAEDVERGKPDPQVFLLAARRLAVEPQRCIVVEDAPAGLEGARRAGMRTIGVQTTHRNMQADRLVGRLDDLPPDTFDQLMPNLP
jgi:beta-phosphoglucomutase